MADGLRPPVGGQDATAVGRLLGLGVGPGDPELVTVKAVRLLQESPIVAHFAARGRKGNAYSIIEGYLLPHQQVVPLYYPVTTEILPPPFCYETSLRDFYDQSAEQLVPYLERGQSVAVVCEGDPFFYGSFMYLHDRLAGRYPSEVVPGVCSMLASASVLGAPLVYRNQMLSVLSGVLSEDALRQRMAAADAFAVMKLGRNFAKVRRAIASLGLLERALYVERATMTAQKIVPFAEVDPATVPYFAMVLVPGQAWEGTREVIPVPELDAL